MLLGETNGLTKPKRGSRQTIIQHQDIEEYLGRYCGLMLYVKEMDEAVYGRLCAVSCCLHLDLVDPFADRIRFQTGIFLCLERIARYADQGVTRCLPWASQESIRGGRRVQ